MTAVIETQNANGAPEAPIEAPAAPESPPQSPWEGLNGDYKGLVENKGWKSREDALKSYMELERLRGVPESELLRLPKEGDQEAWNALYARLGRPEKPEDYGLEVPEGGIDLRALAHEAGLSKAQVERLQKGLGELASKLQEQHSEAAQQAQARRAEQETAQLKEEWGNNYDKNVVAAQRGVKALGWDADTLDKLEAAMGTRWVYEEAFKIGRGLSEHGGPLGENRQSGFGMSPEAARVEFNSWATDPAKIARLQHENREVRMAAQAERSRLRSIGWPEG